MGAPSSGTYNVKDLYLPNFFGFFIIHLMSLVSCYAICQSYKELADAEKAVDCLKKAIAIDDK